MEIVANNQANRKIDGPVTNLQDEFVTIAIPTFNRSQMLKQSLASALVQDYDNIRILVLDNASTDDTQSVIKLFKDSRITYFRNEINEGMVRNWNRAIEFNTSPYLVVLQDDDVLLPKFISESLLRLKKYPNAGFSYAFVRHIDAHGALGRHQDTSGTPVGVELIEGQEILHQIVNGLGWSVFNSAVVLRASALSVVGFFDSPHSKHSIDFDLLLRLAANFDVVPVPMDLAYVRSHSGQVTETEYRSNNGTGPLGYSAERIDALAYLLRSKRAQDPNYREWLCERLLCLNALQSSYSYSLLPRLYWSWEERYQMAHRDVASFVPHGEKFILIDGDQWGVGGEISGRKAIPFPSKDGLYWGVPRNNAGAVCELRVQLKEGIKFIVVAWPAFWWLENFPQFKDYLFNSADKIFRTSRIVAFKFDQKKIG